MQYSTPNLYVYVIDVHVSANFDEKLVIGISWIHQRHQSIMFHLNGRLHESYLPILHNLRQYPLLSYITLTFIPNHLQPSFFALPLLFNCCLNIVTFPYYNLLWSMIYVAEPSLTESFMD